MKGKIRKITIGDYVLVGILLTVMFLPLTLFIRGLTWFEVIPVFGISLFSCGLFLFFWYLTLFPSKKEE